MIVTVVLWVGVIWAVVGLGFVVLFAATEFRTSNRPLRERLLLLLWVFVAFVFAWPFVLIFAGIQIRREIVLERACYGGVRKAQPAVTELEWQRGGDAVRLLVGLAVPLSERKRRLFACACCRRIWERLDDDRCKEAVSVAEKFADGNADLSEVRQALGRAGAAANVYLNGGVLEAGAAAKACQDCLLGDGLAAAERAAVSRYWQQERERRAQCELLREIVGNPFRPLPARVFPPEIVELARAIHEGDHVLFPLLADALDDLGEYEAAEHCRTGKHLKGCHVVDWVMGYR